MKGYLPLLFSSKILLGFIVLIAFILRFHLLSSNPPSLTWDEASWGYNAYSLGIDGKDEFGKFLPITFLESFGDFKPPLYAYLSIVPVKLFGLNEFSTRFASAFFGVLTVLLTFFLTKEIFKKKSNVIPLLSAFVLAISPWHILLSRAAFEANVATFFITLGVYLFLFSLRRSKWILVVSFIAFVLSMYTFNTARIVAPLLIFGLFLFNRKEVFRAKKEVITALVVGFILFLPLLLFLLTPQAKLRFAEVNIFSDSSVINTANQEIANDKNAIWSKTIHNRRLIYGVEYLKHYFDNVNPLFLFVRGDGNPKFSIQDVGQLYMWEAPFLIIGILFLFKKKEGNWWIIPYWLIVGIIPAGTARETPHALRIEAVLPTFQILTAYGLFYGVSSLSSKKIRRVVPLFLLILVFFNFAYFYHNYFSHYPKEFSGEWQYGYKEAINYVNSVQASYDRIVFTESLGRPYIYALFYSGYSPFNFRKEAVVEKEALGFVHVNKFGKYVFTKDVLGANSQGKTLYIDVPGNIPNKVQILKEINLLNGRPALVGYTK